VDALLGITMAVTLVTLMTFAISDARNVFEYARERNLLLDAYDGHAGDIPLSTQTKNSWYGNDRIETVTTVSPADIGTSSAAAPRSPYTQSVSFSEIHIQPFSESADLAGTPLCSVDFTHHIYPKNGMLAADGMETSPEIVPVLLPVDHSLPLTDVEVRGDIAYVSADSTVYSAPDMVIVDISDRRYPSLIASVSSGPGIAAFKLAGNRVYAAAASTAAGFVGIFFIIWLIFIFGMFAVMIFFAVIWIIMLIDVIKRQKWNDDNEKIMWILIVVLLGGIGAIIYYFAIRRQRGPA